MGTTHDLKLAGSIFVSLDNHIIVKVDTSDGTSTVIAGIPGELGSSGDGGAATSAKLNNPYGLDIDDDGNIYIADQGNNKIRKIDTNGIITTIAGTGNNGFSGDGAAATSSNLSSPYDIALDGNGNLYIADSNNSRIRMIGTNGNISTIVGTGESGFDGNGGGARISGRAAACRTPHFEHRDIFYRGRQPDDRGPMRQGRRVPYWRFA